MPCSFQSSRGTAAGSSAEPVGEQVFRCDFEIVTGEDGEMEADIRAYGNGVDIVGTFEQDLRPDGGGYSYFTRPASTPTTPAGTI